MNNVLKKIVISSRKYPNREREIENTLLKSLSLFTFQIIEKFYGFGFQFPFAILKRTHKDIFMPFFLVKSRFYSVSLFLIAFIYLFIYLAIYL